MNKVLKQYSVYLKQKCLLQLLIIDKTLIIIRNVSLAANQCSSLISEGSCDTEEWNNKN